MVRPTIAFSAIPMSMPSPCHSSLALLSFSAVFWLAGCAAQPATVNAPPPMVQSATPVQEPVAQTGSPSLEWAGTYQAVLPCEGSPGTAISVQLRPDMTATVRERRLGTSTDQGAPQTYHGPFTFGTDAQAQLISLGDPQQPVPSYRFWVSDGWIELRERTTGAPISQSSLYRLRQTSLR